AQTQAQAQAQGQGYGCGQVEGQGKGQGKAQGQVADLRKGEKHNQDWSREEIERLRELVPLNTHYIVLQDRWRSDQTLKTDWAAIASVLGRTANACYNKWRCAVGLVGE
ncbi:hypothetical protein B484DRAFT_408721, partial [Ochromonadaceae sp. CCMP2298]